MTWVAKNMILYEHVLIRIYKCLYICSVSIHISKTMFGMLKISNRTIIYTILLVTSEYLVAKYKLKYNQVCQFLGIFFSLTAIINIIGIHKLLNTSKILK